jgi:hypothetical protein
VHSVCVTMASLVSAYDVARHQTNSSTDCVKAAERRGTDMPCGKKGKKGKGGKRPPMR